MCSRSSVGKPLPLALGRLQCVTVPYLQASWCAGPVRPEREGNFRELDQTGTRLYTMKTGKYFGWYEQAPIPLMSDHEIRQEKCRTAVRTISVQGAPDPVSLCPRRIQSSAHPNDKRIWPSFEKTSLRLRERRGVVTKAFSDGSLCLGYQVVRIQTAPSHHFDA
jgi:hypothetical protein